MKVGSGMIKTGDSSGGILQFCLQSAFDEMHAEDTTDY